MPGVPALPARGLSLHPPPRPAVGKKQQQQLLSPRWETQKPPPISGQGATAAQGWEAPGHTQALGPSAALCLNNPVA